MKAIDNVKIKLLQTAKEVIRTQGLQDFNIRTIAKTAGVSIGTVYNYYPAKSDLVVATMQALLTECVSVINKETSEDLYQEFKDVYFAILGYFHLFQGDVMNDLATLAVSKEKPRASVEYQHMMILKESFARILIRHKSEINPDLFQKYGINKIIELILTVFTAYLRKNPQNYEIVDFFLHRLLGK
jgi:AcrR family transcriptional regulator